MKIALAQMEVTPNLAKKNLERMLRLIEQAKKNNVDLIAFPEMCVGGYLLGDKWTDENFCRNLQNYNKVLQDASKGIAIAYGNIFVDTNINKRVNDNNFHPNKDGRIRKYNAINVFQNGKPARRLKETNILPLGVQPKTLLPTYRFFDDERYFFGLQDVAKDFGVELKILLQPFEIEVGKEKIPVGFELCEDLWCNDYRKEGNALNPTKMLIENGAEYIVNLSASPWTFGKNNARDRRVAFLREEIGDKFKPFFYVNCTGTQNNGKNIVTFDGGTTVYNKYAKPIIFAKKPYETELIITDKKDLEKKEQIRIETDKIAQKYDAIIRGIRHLKDIQGAKENPRFVIGLSGGIDSAVVAALLVQAVGKEKVIAINIPTRYNSKKTKDAARYIARELEIPYEQIPIEELVNANEEIIDRYDLDGRNAKLTTLNKENIQAKIRGTNLLSNIAAKYNALFTNNGNKLEIALGYATLYGDVNGAICPIGDLTKTEVVELAKYLNNEIFKKEIVPNTLIPDDLFRFKDNQIKPSAELKDAQIDPMKFGYHDALIDAYTDYKKKTTEDVLQWYKEGTLEKNLGIITELIKRWNIDNPKIFIDDLEWFDRNIQRNVFKRIQAPPIIVTSKTAFGYDLRESQLPYETTLEYDRLKKEIMKNMTVYKKKGE